MFELQFEKTGSKEKPSYEARLVWDTLYLKVASVYKGETTTEFGPMPCWICEGVGGATTKHKTLGAAKDELESGLFNEIQTRRGLESLTMPLAPEPTPTTVEAETQPHPESPAKPKRLFGRSE